MSAPWLRIEADTDAAHAPVRARLMEMASLQPGQNVLDIGPGGGVTLIDAAAAVGPSGHVTGLEIAPPFADRARERVPSHVSVVEGDGQTHRFEPAQFDAAISLFGVMFFQDSVAAFANIRSALRPGGALTFACWGPPEKNPYFSLAGKIAAEVFGPGETFDPNGPGPMRFGNADLLNDILVQAGWTPEIVTEDVDLTPLGAADNVAKVHMTIGAAAMRIRQAKEAGTLTDDQRENVRAGLTQAFGEMEVAGEVKIPANIHFVRAIA